MIGEATIYIPLGREHSRTVVDTAQKWAAEAYGGFTVHGASGG